MLLSQLNCRRSSEWPWEILSEPELWCVPLIKDNCRGLGRHGQSVQERTPKGRNQTSGYCNQRTLLPNCTVDVRLQIQKDRNDLLPTHPFFRPYRSYETK